MHNYYWDEGSGLLFSGTLSIGAGIAQWLKPGALESMHPGSDPGSAYQWCVILASGFTSLSPSAKVGGRCLSYRAVVTVK